MIQEKSTHNKFTCEASILVSTSYADPHSP